MQNSDVAVDLLFYSMSFAQGQSTGYLTAPLATEASIFVVIQTMLVLCA